MSDEIDTIIEEKIEDKIDDIEEKIEDKIDDIEEKIEDKIDDIEDPQETGIPEQHINEEDIKWQIIQDQLAQIMNNQNLLQLQVNSLEEKITPTIPEIPEVIPETTEEPEIEIQDQLPIQETIPQTPMNRKPETRKFLAKIMSK